MSALAIVNGMVLTVDPENHIYESGLVVIDNGRIVAVGPSCSTAIPPGAEVIDASGCAVLPGFVNAHTYVAQILLRGGISHSRVLYDWLTNVVIPGVNAYSPDDLRLAVRLYCAEAMRAGVTSIVANEEPDPADPEGMARVALDTFAETGLRVVYAFMFRDMAPDVVWQGVPEERDRNLPVIPALQQTLDTIERLDVEYRAKTNGRVRVWPSPATSATVSEEGLRASSALAARLGGSWALHLGETTTEHLFRGVSGVRYLESIGALDDRLLAAHCVHIDEDDIAALARHNSRVSTNPASNCYLGSGIAPVPAMLRAGVRVGIGSDDANCNDSVNPLGDMKLLALIHRGLHQDPKIISPEKVFRMATADGAVAAGLPEVGSLEPGKIADVSTLRLGGPQLTPFHSPLAALVFQAYGSEIETSIVDGRVVMRDRRPSFAHDVEALSRDAQAASAAVVARAGIREALYPAG